MFVDADGINDEVNLVDISKRLNAPKLLQNGFLIDSKRNALRTPDNHPEPKPELSADETTP
jgi:hypothetical protein